MMPDRPGATTPTSSPTATGRSTYQFNLPSLFVAVYTVTSNWDLGLPADPATVVHTFTDAPAEIDFTQCANDTNNNDVKDDCDWTNGALNANDSIITEGDAVAERLIQNIPGAGTHTIRFEYQFTKGDVDAYDFLTNPDHTQNTPALLNACGEAPSFIDPPGAQTATDACNAMFGAGSQSPTVPSDNFDAVANRETPASRAFKVGCSPTCSGTTQVTFPSLGGGDDPGESHVPNPDPSDCFQNCGDNSAFVDVTFTTTAADTKVGMWMGAHIAASFDPNPSGIPDGWGTGFGGSSAPGASYHFKYTSLDDEGGGGSRDNQLQSGVVVPPGSIIVEKNIEPNGATGSFNFTGTANGMISTDGGQIVVNGLTPGTYTSTEGAAAGFDLSSIVCNDSNSTGNVGTRTATFVVASGETVKCTFTNTQQNGTIEIEKQTIPGGGTGFGFTGTDLPGTADDTFTLNDDGVKTINNVPTGTYHVSENAPTPGYDLTNLVCTDPDNGSSVSVANREATIDVDPNETVHCTYTNTKDATLTVVKGPRPRPAGLRLRPHRARPRRRTSTST